MLIEKITTKKKMRPNRKKNLFESIYIKALKDLKLN